MLAYMWFGIFWILAFIIASNDFVIIVSACTWYFSRKDIPDDDGIAGDSEVMKGFIWSIKYHPGSLAFGSILVALVWTIRTIFEYVGDSIQKSNPGNCCTICLVGCVKCCIDCFDRFVRFISSSAYIYMAISNESFCNSALNAFILVLKNAAKFSFVNSIGGVFMLIARVCIAIITTAICYIILHMQEDV